MNTINVFLPKIWIKLCSLYYPFALFVKDVIAPIPKMRELSFILGAKAVFCDGYDSDDNNGPFVPASIMIETVEEDNNIIPALESPPVVETVMFLDTLKEVFHHVGFDKLYNSSAFC